MNLEIRPAVEQDMEDVWTLIRELAIYEKEPNAVEISVKDLINHAFSNSPLFVCFVAILNNKTVGMSLGYPRYSTWKGPTMHLEDLIVTENFRGLGIGQALFSNFIKYSYNKEVKRIEWAVLNWNFDAIKFYESNGAKVSDDWHIAQMNEKAISDFINKNK